MDNEWIFIELIYFIEIIYWLEKNGIKNNIKSIKVRNICRWIVFV